MSSITSPVQSFHFEMDYHEEDFGCCCRPVLGTFAAEVSINQDKITFTNESPIKKLGFFARHGTPFYSYDVRFPVRTNGSECGDVDRIRVDHLQFNSNFSTGSIGSIPKATMFKVIAQARDKILSGLGIPHGSYCSFRQDGYGELMTPDQLKEMFTPHYEDPIQ